MLKFYFFIISWINIFDWDKSSFFASALAALTVAEKIKVLKINIVANQIKVFIIIVINK